MKSLTNKFYTAALTIGINFLQILKRRSEQVNALKKDKTKNLSVKAAGRLPIKKNGNVPINLLRINVPNSNYHLQHHKYLVRVKLESNGSQYYEQSTGQLEVNKQLLNWNVNLSGCYQKERN